MEKSDQSGVCPHCKGDAPLYTVRRGFDVFRCSHCGLGFVFPLPDPAKIYSEDYFAGAHDGYGYASYDTDKEPMVPTFKKYIEIIKSLVPSGKLLDVGAATGFFVKMANDVGFKGTGIEISEFAAAEGRKKGLDIRTGMLQDIQNEKFDVVTMLDVIEHVTEPQKELNRAGELLRSGGVLIINTPDFSSRYARLLGPRWHLILPPEHLYYYPRTVLKEMLGLAGFETKEMTTIGKQFTIPYIVSMLYKWLEIPFLGKVATWTSTGMISKIAIPINLYDNVFIVAQKR